MVHPFREEEYKKGIAALKNNKVASRDDVQVEQLKHLGQMANKWLHTMLNVCFTGNKIQDYRQTQARERLRDSEELQTNPPLNRIAPVVEQRLIKEHAGFRTGNLCTSQLLNLTHHIEDDYQRGMVTAAAFVDLFAAYDTVNHRILIQKFYNITQDSPQSRVIQNMLFSSRLYVELNNERSRWRKQKNGLPHESVLSPILFNI